MVEDYLDGKGAREIAEGLGISGKTFYCWLGRYRSDGAGGLANRPSGPRSSPTRSSREVEQGVLGYRRLNRVGPARIALALGMPASTVYAILRRNGENRLYPKQRRPITRYEKEYPGELVHIDVKELPSIDKGPMEYQFTAIDD